MAGKSNIEWTDASWNPVRARLIKKSGTKAVGSIGWHCEHATTGCVICYAERDNKRFGTGLPFKPGHLDSGEIELFLDETMLRQPLHWKRPRRIFVGSMTDLFGRFVPDEWLFEIFAVMGACEDQQRGHSFQVLTKRADRMQQWVMAHGSRAWNSCRLGPNAWPARNVWLGVSAERQEEANQRIPELLATPAAVRFVSIEPMLGRISLHALNLHTPRPLDALRGVQCVPDDSPEGYHNEPIAKLDLVILGGESGPKARPLHPLWARDMRDWCKATDVAFFFKQWGEFLPWSQFSDAHGVEDHPEQTRFRTMEWEGDYWNDVGFPQWCDTADGNIDDEQCVGRVGKAKAGRLLDGVEHNEFPRVPA